MVIITDGQENASKEFRKEQVSKMIVQKQKELEWQLVFLSADLDAINEAMAQGVKFGSSLAFDKTSEGATGAWESASHKIKEYRTGISKSVSFDEEDRDKQDIEKRRK